MPDRIMRAVGFLPRLFFYNDKDIKDFVAMGSSPEGQITKKDGTIKHSVFLDLLSVSEKSPFFKGGFRGNVNV